MNPVRVVVAPNPFKGTFGSPAVASAIARGVKEALPGAEVIEVPMADGGEGTLDALVTAAGGTRQRVEVEGAVGEPVHAEIGFIDGGTTAVIELAQACALSMIEPEHRQPGLASTYGVGQMLVTARAAGARTFIVGLGGSSTTDGGAGIAQALGYHLLDAEGKELGRGGSELARLDRIQRGDFDAGWHAMTVRVAVDVRNPLIGQEGAAMVYAPQKGAGPDLAAALDRALTNLAAVIKKDLRMDVAHLVGGGAAGGAGAGLVAFAGARIEEGSAVVSEAVKLDKPMRHATIVFTGEGRVDDQTRFGKGPWAVIAAAPKTARVIVLAGSLGPGWEALSEFRAEVVEVAPGKSATLEALESAASRTLLKSPSP